jgi:hypothetical protein
MADTFIVPSLIARLGLATLYNNLILASLVWRDFDGDFTGKQGDTITIRKPAVFTAEEFDRSKGVTIQDATEDSIPLTLDTIANVSFAVTDEQMTLEVSDFRAQLLDPAMMAIAQKIDADLAEELVLAAQSKGQLAAKGNSDPANIAFREAREVLTRKKLPTSERYSVLSPEAVSTVLGDELLVKVNESGTSDALREAIVGKVYGVQTYESQVLGAGPGERGEADGVAFHRTAVTLASRPLQAPRGVATEMVETADFKSISLRVVYAYNHNIKQDEVSVDTLYGIAQTRPEGAVELDFHQGS